MVLYGSFQTCQSAMKGDAKIVILRARILWKKREKCMNTSYVAL